jgi:hypothetical protein
MRNFLVLRAYPKYKDVACNVSSTGFYKYVSFFHGLPNIDTRLFFRPVAFEKCRFLIIKIAIDNVEHIERKVRCRFWKIILIIYFKTCL